MFFNQERYRLHLLLLWYCRCPSETLNVQILICLGSEAVYFLMITNCVVQVHKHCTIVLSVRYLKNCDKHKGHKLTIMIYCKKLQITKYREVLEGQQRYAFWKYCYMFCVSLNRIWIGKRSKTSLCTVSNLQQTRTSVLVCSLQAISSFRSEWVFGLWGGRVWIPALWEHHRLFPLCVVLWAWIPHHSHRRVCG